MDGIKKGKSNRGGDRKGVFYGITFNIILLGLASLLMDISGEIITAVLPLFLTSLGAGTIIIGLVGGLSDAGISVFKVLSGYWSDKYGKRKPFVVFGYAFSSLLRFFIAISTTWPLVLVFRPLERLGKGIRDPPRDALMAETTSKKVHGKVFGFHQALDNIGGIIGAVLAFLFIGYIGLNFNASIFIAAIIAFTSLIPLLFVKEIIKQRKKITLRVGIKNLSPRFKKFLGIVTIFALANFSYMFFLLKAQQVFNSYPITILLYLFYIVPYAIFTIPGGMLSDKIGRKNALMIGYAIFVLAFIGFATLSSTLIQFMLLFAIYGIGYAFVEPNQRAFASDLASKELGTALGTFYMAIGLAALPAGLIAGSLWRFISPNATFFFGAAVAFVALMALIFAKSLGKK